MKSRVFWLTMFLRDVLLAPIAYCIPRNPRKILFGAWSGRQFSDNPKYFLLRIKRMAPHVQCYWIGNESIRSRVQETPGVKFVLKGSWLTVWHMLTAKFYVCNVNWRDDLGWVPTCGRVKILNLWHGIPYKKIGACQFDGYGKTKETQIVTSMLRLWVRSVLIRWHNWCYTDVSWTSVSSEKMKNIMCKAFPRRFLKECMVMAGLPRNDFLIQNKSNIELQKQLKAKYASLLGIPIDKKWYLYLPTWRHGEGAAFSFMASSCQVKYQEILQNQNAVLIEKQHPIVLNRLNLCGQEKGNIFTINEALASQLDMQELLLISARLITDYSSCFFDYLLLNRPCIHFVYDFKEYVECDSGVEYELCDIAAGPLVETEEQLLNALNKEDFPLLSQRGKYWQAPIEFEQGEAAIRLIDTLSIK